jgi:CPA1 family monovalent cation:H+ antiporter
VLLLDGRRIPRASLFPDRVIIIEPASDRVVLTVVTVGYLVEWLIPSMRLPVAFALAAVISPTDPIAVSRWPRVRPSPSG